MSERKTSYDIQFLVYWLSDGYSENDLLYIWTKGANNSIKIAADTTLSQFDIVGIPAGNMTKYDRGLGG